MRTARDFVEDYRRKGYPDDRIRIVASMRPEPLRSEALRILDGESKQQKPVEESPPDVKASEPNIPEVPAKIAAQGAEEPGKLHSDHATTNHHQRFRQGR